jgi:hypothetical protein
MSLLGEFTKGFAIFTGVIWILAIIGLIVTGHRVIALLLLLVLIMPLPMMAHEYLKNKKKEQT